MHCEQQGNDESVFKRLEDRIAALEAEVAHLRLAGSAVTPQQVDAALRDLGEKTKDGKISEFVFQRPVPLDRGCVGEHQGAGKRTRAAPLQRKTAEPAKSAAGAVKMKSKPCTQSGHRIRLGNFLDK